MFGVSRSIYTVIEIFEMIERPSNTAAIVLTRSKIGRCKVEFELVDIFDNRNMY